MSNNKENLTKRLADPTEMSWECAIASRDVSHAFRRAAEILKGRNCILDFSALSEVADLILVRAEVLKAGSLEERQAASASGRSPATEPNLQNIRPQTELGQQLRHEGIHAGSVEVFKREQAKNPQQAAMALRELQELGQQLEAMKEEARAGMSEARSPERANWLSGQLSALNQVVLALRARMKDLQTEPEPRPSMGETKTLGQLCYEGGQNHDLRKTQPRPTKDVAWADLAPDTQDAYGRLAEQVAAVFHALPRL